jgi:hypothetical protein
MIRRHGRSAARFLRLMFVAVLVAIVGPVAAQPSDLADIERAARQYREELDILSGWREKNIRFGPSYAERCPQFTGLLHSSRFVVKLIVPHRDMASDLVLSSTTDLQNDAMDFLFARPSCRYLMKIKRFGTPNGESANRLNATVREMVYTTDLPPGPDDKPGLAFRWHGNKYWVDKNKLDPSNRGYAQLPAAFVGLDNLVFTAMAYFAPSGLTILMTDAAQDLRVDVEKRDDAQLYDISFRNADARVSLALTREIYVDGAWRRDLDK